MELYYLFSWSGTINKIIQQYHFLVSRKPTSWNNSWAFLQCQFLVVPVYCLQNNQETESDYRLCSFLSTGIYKTKFTCSTLTVNGPLDWHSGQEPTLTSEYEFWKKGPKIAPHLLQSYFTCCNWGKTPERRVTTPPIRIIVFKWICLRRVTNSSTAMFMLEVVNKSRQVKDFTLYCESDHKQVSW